MEIYTLVEAPLLGQLGPKTRINDRTPCPTCGIMRPLEVDYLDYLLDYWDGEEFLFVARQYVVTASLRKIIEQAEIAGISFAAMQAGLDEEFAEPGETTELPQFWHMKIADTLRAGLGWRDPAGRCDGCGWALWTDNDFTFIAPDKAHTDPKIPHRTVFRSNHDGQDFFNLDDRGPAVMTAKFRRLLEQAGIAELKFQPADFIDG